MRAAIALALVLASSSALAQVNPTKPSDLPLRAGADRQACWTLYTQYTGALFNNPAKADSAREAYNKWCAPETKK